MAARNLSPEVRVLVQVSITRWRLRNPKARHADVASLVTRDVRDLCGSSSPTISRQMVTYYSAQIRKSWARYRDAGYHQLMGQWLEIRWEQVSELWKAWAESCKPKQVTEIHEEPEWELKAQGRGKKRKKVPVMTTGPDGEPAQRYKITRRIRRLEPRYGDAQIMAQLSKVLESIGSVLGFGDQDVWRAATGELAQGSLETPDLLSKIGADLGLLEGVEGFALSEMGASTSQKARLAWMNRALQAESLRRRGRFGPGGPGGDGEGGTLEVVITRREVSDDEQPN